MKMGKVYKALSRAEAEKQISNYPVVSSRVEMPALYEPGRRSASSWDEWHKEIEIRISSKYPNGDMKVIMFTAPSAGAGATSTAVEFAFNLVHFFHNKVLLIDANFRSPAITMRFIQDDLGTLGNLTNAISEINKEEAVQFPGRLQVMTNNGFSDENLHLFGSEKFQDFLKNARKIFDFVIFDAPPVTLYPEARLLSKKVDGVIMVVAAGDTRKQVVLRAKKEIDLIGAHLLGVVLNRRKYFIPKWLYDKL